MRKILFIFGQLTDTDVAWLARAGRRQRVAAGSVLIREGIPVERLYIVLQGELLVSQGPSAREVARLGTGEVVGEMSFIDQKPPSATVSAAGEAVVYSVPKLLLLAQLEADPPFAARFYKAVATFLSDRVRQALGPQNGDAEGELDGSVLDTLTRAGERFDSFCKQLLDA